LNRITVPYFQYESYASPISRDAIYITEANREWKHSKKKRKKEREKEKYDEIKTPNK